ncbi:MAG: amidohydrolase family protein [Planctomycetota bacterium]|nr:amidohydrolase family protein [Planctomycetota bacterium]
MRDIVQRLVGVVLGAVLGAGGLLGSASPAHGQETPVAFVGARVVPVAGEALDRGVVVVQGGKILRVGPMDTPLPPNATRVDVSGKVILPGLVDTHSHIGGAAGADSSGPIQPDVRVWDSLNPLDPGFRRAIAGGITTVNVMPGSGHLLSGQTVYLKLRTRPGAARSIEDLCIYAPNATRETGTPLGGIKMANGTNSIGGAPFPGTRGKSAALVRQRFIDAQAYRAKKDRAARDNTPDAAPAPDLALEALGEALDGTRIVHHHTHRADDIMTVLRLQREFGFRVVLHHASEAWKVAGEIARAERETGGKVLGTSVIVIDSPGGKLEAAELSWTTGGALERAGASVCIHTDDWITDSRLFLRSGAFAVRGGMSEAGALRALTIDGARMLDLADRVGTLEPGKDADLVVLSGDPFSVYTVVEQTWVEGVKVFDRADPKDRLWAVGGFGAGEPQKPYLCCAEGAGGVWVWRSQQEGGQ